MLHSQLKAAKKVKDESPSPTANRPVKNQAVNRLVDTFAEKQLGKWTDSQRSKRAKKEKAEKERKQMRREAARHALASSSASSPSPSPLKRKSTPPKSKKNKVNPIPDTPRWE